MSAEDLIQGIHPLEILLLLHFGERTSIFDREAVAAGVLKEAQMRTVIEWGLAKKTLELAGETRESFLELTEIGQRYQQGAIPELAILGELQSQPVPMASLQSLPEYERSEIGPAIGTLRKSGAIEVVKGEARKGENEEASAPFRTLQAALKEVGESGRLPASSLEESLLQSALSKVNRRQPSRGYFRLSEEVTREIALTPLGASLKVLVEERGLSGEEVGQLTPEMLGDGSWKNRTFRSYHIGLAPPREVVGRRHPYRAFLDFARSKLLALGFEEMSGPLVESEYWNMDALFMPQFHPARAIHDAYFLKDPENPGDFLHARDEPENAERVADAHRSGEGYGSRGWRYDFDSRRTRRLVLRSQGTALSARWLSRAQVPGKYFAMARCFRYDRVDKSHLPDFFQVEGIVLGDEVSMSTLLGLLDLFARELACADEVKVLPAYFPFTEPSVECHIKHPEIGWMEMGGAGIFRPEVTGPQGVSEPVIAWGLGLDRMAMVALGIEHIGDLFNPNLDFIRTKRFSVNR